MTPLILALALSADPGPARFAFADAAGPDGTPHYRAVLFADQPPRLLAGAPQPAAGTQFGLARVGSGLATALGLVWQPAAKTLWLDADGDHKLTAAERHDFAERRLERPVTLVIGDAKLPRTLLLRRGGDGTVYVAVRGHTHGTLTVNGKPMKAALTDGDGDGCFDAGGIDRVWLDFDGDGQFDALSEQFPLGTPIPVGADRYLIRPDPTGTVVRVAARGSAVGTLKPVVKLQPGAVLRTIEASLVSEYGELAVVKSLDPVAVPAGCYRVESLNLKVADAKGRLWDYHFAGHRTFAHAVETGKETPAEFLAGLAFAGGVTATEVAPGRDVTASPSWQTPAGVYLSKCEIDGTATGADIVLADSGGTPLDRAVSGFL